MKMSLHRRTVLALAAPLVLAAGLYGCGSDDDDDNPTGPGPGGTSEFDRSTAISQAQSAAPQAVALVQSMGVLAGGLGKHAGGGYVWNEDAGRWEYHYTWDQAGYAYDWFYTVQYFDDQDQAQENAAGATRIAHSMTGVGDYHHQDGATIVDYDFTYQYAVSTSGLGTDTLLMTGNGGWDIDYSYTNGQQQYDSEYALAWQTLNPGITIPAGGGCPTGTIRYDLNPYRLDVVFDGTGSAMATLYDGGGSPVQGGGSTHALSCTP